MQRSRGQGSIFKRKHGGPWRLSWYDASGKRRERSARTTDRAVAGRILSKIVADVALRRDGIIDAKADTFAEHGKRPLTAHLDDWKRYLSAKGNGADHVKRHVARARRIIDGCRFTHWADVSPGKVTDHLAELRAGGLGATASNHHLTAFKGFCRWVVADGRAMASPVAHLKALNARTDRRRERRALEPAELDRIIQAAEHGPTYRRITGHDRAMLYRVAAGTGFRGAELRAVTVADLRLDDDPPCITLSAKHTKNRQETRQPIHDDLAQLLRAWIDDRETARDCAGGTIGGRVVSEVGGNAQRAFPTMPERTAEMLTADLRRARARWIMEAPDPRERRRRRESDFLAETDAAGRVADFHALRVSYITALVKGGASVKVAQTLARHSDPRLTMNIYTQLRAHDLTGALDALPPVVPRSTEPQQLRATGTDDAQASNENHCDHTLKRQQLERETVRNRTTHDSGRAKNCHAGKAVKSAKSSIKRGVLRGGTSRNKNTPGRTRTCDFGIRNPVLYPAELRARVCNVFRHKRCARSCRHSPSSTSGSAVPIKRDTTLTHP